MTEAVIARNAGHPSVWLAAQSRGVEARHSAAGYARATAIDCECAAGNNVLKLHI